MEKINNVGYIGSVSRGTIVKYGDIILREIRGGGGREERHRQGFTIKPRELTS